MTGNGGPAAPASTVALVTCSYGPDLHRCRRLCRSTGDWLDTSIEHVLLVPRRDVPEFRRMAPASARVVAVESIIPWWLRRAPFVRKWWVSLRTPPVRGWIMQQLTKLAAVEAVPQDVLVFADSDVTLVRPFTPGLVIREGRVRLHRVPGAGRGERHLLWNRVAAMLLGAEPPEPGYFGADYIGQLVSWRRATVLGLHDRLGEVAGRPWIATLAGTLHFAEYILYGAFAEHVAPDHGGHFFDAGDLCFCSWHYDLADPTERARFVAGLGPGHAAVLVQSNLGLPEAEEQALLAAVRDAASTMETTP